MGKTEDGGIASTALGLDRTAYWGLVCRGGGDRRGRAAGAQECRQLHPGPDPGRYATAAVLGHGSLSRGAAGIGNESGVSDFQGCSEELSGVASVPLATLSGSFLKGLARAAPRGPEAVLIKAVGEVAELTPAYTNGKI